MIIQLRLTADVASLPMIRPVWKQVGSYLLLVQPRQHFFEKDGRFFILNHLSREGKQNGYIDHFAGSDSDYRIILDVNKTKRISKWRTNYAGVLKNSQRNKVKTIKVNGINKEFELNK